MTKKRDNPKFTEEQALEILYQGSIIDLSAESYMEAIIELRKENPALAKRVERTLAKRILPKVFSRRQITWHRTSHGMRCRLKLLPDNPHFRADIGTIRQVLQIPQDHVKTVRNCPFFSIEYGFVKEDSKWNAETVRHIAERTLAERWLNVYESFLRNDSIGNGYPPDYLPEEMFLSAVKSSRVKLDTKTVPEWLSRPISNIVLNERLKTPLEHAVGRLIKRYCLPSHVIVNLKFFILTEDYNLISSIDPIEVTKSLDDRYWITAINPTQNVNPAEHPIDTTGAFTICIKGLDEYISKEDWDDIWEKHVEIHKQILWSQRGGNPSGRRTVDISRLQKVVPYYQKMITEDRNVKDFLNGTFDEKEELGEFDEKTIRTTFRELKELLSPI